MKIDNFTFATMRLCSIILLVFFVIFSSLPTLVVMFDKEVDISFSYSNSEEEETNNSISEVKILFKLKKIDYTFLLGVQYDFLQFIYLENSTLVLASEVNVPPPRCVNFFV